MRKLAMMLVAAAALSYASDVSAQTTANASASITIPTLLNIGVTNTTVTFAQPTFADYDALSIAAAAQSVVSTRGNVLHDVTVAAGAANLTYTGAGSDPSKPSSDLQWSVDGATWAGLSTTAADVAAGVARGTNANAATVSYRMLLDELNDVPGTYSLSFTYTVVAN